jgi:hypothetical protein
MGQQPLTESKVDPVRVVEQTQLREAYSKYMAKRQEAYNQFDKAETAVLSVAQAYGIRKF